MIAEIEVVHGVADLHDVLLHHLLAYDQLSEVDDVLKLLDDGLEAHHFQVLVELYVFDDECEPDGLVGADHEVLEHVDDLVRLIDAERL
jgi:hypothetical protein